MSTTDPLGGLLRPYQGMTQEPIDSNYFTVTFAPAKDGEYAYMRNGFKDKGEALAGAQSEKVLLDLDEDIESYTITMNRMLLDEATGLRFEDDLLHDVTKADSA